MIEAIYTPGDQAENLTSTRRGAVYDEALVGSSKESGRNGLYFLSFKEGFKLINYSFGLLWVSIALTRACFRCGERELLPSCRVQASRCAGFSSCRAQALGRKL